MGTGTHVICLKKYVRMGIGTSSFSWLPPGGRVFSSTRISITFKGDKEG